MKLTAARADAFIRRPDPSISVILLYGPDGGLVRERANLLACHVVERVDDPFRVSELAGDQLETQPQLLVDEAQALCFMGGRRLVWVRQAGERSVKALDLLLQIERPEAFVVIEADDLASSSKLRQLAERSQKVAAIACYREDSRNLPTTIRSILEEHGLNPDPDAMNYLVQNLGGDRGVTRRELEKLALYIGEGGDRRVTLADAAAVTGDSAALGLDELLVAILRGRDLERALVRLLSEGEAPVRVVRFLSSQLLRLLRLQAEVMKGTPPDSAIDASRPPVHFRMKPVLKAALAEWPSSRLLSALAALQDAELAMKRARSTDQLLCSEIVGALALRDSHAPA